MKKVTRMFTMSNFELATLATEFVSFMTRDNVEFTAHAVTVAMRTAYK